MIWHDSRKCVPMRRTHSSVIAAESATPNHQPNTKMPNDTNNTAGSDCPAATCSPSLRMDAYYYSFDRTGVEAIDRILCAVASAGKAYHHTECWNDDHGPRVNCEGDTPAEWIQNAANAAAKFIQENA